MGVVACIRGRLATTFAVREAAARPGSLGAQSATEPLAEGTDKAIRIRRVHRLGEDSINVCGFFKGRVAVPGHKGHDPWNRDARVLDYRREPVRFIVEMIDRNAQRYFEDRMARIDLPRHAHVG